MKRVVGGGRGGGCGNKSPEKKIIREKKLRLSLNLGSPCGYCYCSSFSRSSFGRGEKGGLLCTYVLIAYAKQV